MIEIILYIALAVVALFAVVIFIISAVFAKRHRDPDVDPLAGYSVEYEGVPVQQAAAPQVAPVQYAAPAAKPGFDPNSASADEQLAQSLFHYNNAVDSKSDSQINAFRGLLPRHLR